MKRHLHHYWETLIYVVIFLIMFLVPLMTVYIRTSANSQVEFEWNEIWHVWKIMGIFLLLFLVHNFFLAPLLVYKRKKWLYFIGTACLLIISTAVSCLHRPQELPPDFHHRKAVMSQNRADEHFGKGGERTILPQGEMSPGGPDGNLQPKAKEGEMGPGEPDGNFVSKENKRGENGRIHRKPHRPPLFLEQGDIVGFLIVFFMLGMNLGVKFYFKNEQNRKKMEDLEKENLEHQLEYLKFQINPHFFMNTLNNIHALVDIDPEKAKSSIVVLSKMMRYILYEGNRQMIPLQHELDFVGHYIVLMRMRFTDKVRVSVDVPKNVAVGEIPPLLFITFLENAFKHGVSYQDDSYIDLKITVGEQIRFYCKNSKRKKTETELTAEGGVGLANVRSRLDLLYQDEYQLDISDGEKDYKVELVLPLELSKKA